ncbi:MAG: electron transport complex subunit E [Xylanivirga thermophila]|jgi:Na+-translocating ferredoxin:NAD+ oxidoreductase subunit E|uniref:electron transport complex subunit RsxE n=1 Tax=Xylanivirga thermophila TaxID=2496273 RepID=UPI0039F5E4CE
MKLSKVFTNGMINENPTFRLVLGMCPTLAVTTAAVNGIGMGLATTFVLVGSNLVISLLKDFIPSKIRIPSYIVIIATFVTIIGMVMEAYVPALYDSLGIFIPLIVVNCIILARAETFASKNTPLPSIMDGLGVGMGFTLSLTLLGSIREIFGAGTWFGMKVMPQNFQPVLIMILPAGAFITLGLLLGFFNKMMAKPSKKGDA